MGWAYGFSFVRLLLYTFSLMAETVTSRIQEGMAKEVNGSDCVGFSERNWEI